MRSRMVEFLFLGLMAILLIPPQAFSHSKRDLIEGIGEVKLCMKEEEFRSRLEPLLRPYLNRPITRWDTPWPPPKVLIFPPGSGLVPSRMRVSFQDGLLESIWILYQGEDYPGQIESIYWIIRRYLSSRYPEELVGPFTWSVDRWGIVPYFVMIWDRDGNLITLDTDRFFRKVSLAYWARGHRFRQVGLPEKKFCEGAR